MTNRWRSDNLEPVARDSWSAASARCVHGLVWAICRDCANSGWTRTADPLTLPECAGLDRARCEARESLDCAHAGGWALLLAVVFAAGVAIGWALGGLLRG